MCLQTSHTPRDYLNSNINLIRADLNLPEDPEVCVSLTNNSDDDKTPSDSDSIGSCLALSSQVRMTVFLSLLKFKKHTICFVHAIREDKWKQHIWRWKIQISWTIAKCNNNNLFKPNSFLLKCYDEKSEMLVLGSREPTLENGDSHALSTSS